MLGVVCEHVGLSVARILMFRTQNTTIKIFMYMGAWLRAICQECDEENMRVRD